MRITPLDIRKQEFRKGMRGLDAEEVYAFLSTVGDEYEAILNDNKALRERVLELDDKVQEYRTLERTLRDTLITAERVTIESKDNARREANLIIKEAQLEAEKALRDIKTEAMKLRQEVSQLRRQRESYLGRMKVIAESLLKFIEGVEDDFDEEDEAYQNQMPNDSTVAPASTLADPPAANGNLFNAAEAAAAPAIAEPVADRFPGGARGVPADLRAPVVTGTTLPPVPPVPAVPPAEPREFYESRSGSSTQETLADISSIIERMADGREEILGQRPGVVLEGGVVPERSPQRTAPDRSSEPAQFGPIPSLPTGTILNEPHLDEPPRALEATTDDPTPAHGLPLGRAESKSYEGMDLALATATEEIKSDRRRVEPASNAPRGPEVTSEMSLDQIRRDLERRMSREKKGN